MKTTRARLEQYVLALRGCEPTDRAARAELCRTLWDLGERTEALDIFKDLLRNEPAPADPAFDHIYLSGLLMTETCPTPIGRRNRLIQLVELLRLTSDVPGDVVECGCYRGLSSYMMCSYLKRWDERFDGTGYHLFDSFEGLSEPTLDDEVPDGWENEEALRLMTRRGNFAASRELVAANLRAFPRIAFHQGWIPLSFQGLPELHYRFVHIDVDLYDPTLDACNYFFSRLSPGGVMVSDDYSWPGARTAIEDFCADHTLEYEITPSKQAVIRKHRSS